MDPGRFKICCPSCEAEGKARLEMLNRRVRCKHCEHTFRAIPVDGAAAPANAAPKAEKPARESLRGRVEALEREVRKIRRSLPGQLPRYPTAEPAGSEADQLRSQLDRALEAAREAESRQISQKVADANLIDALRREIADLRAHLDLARAPAATAPPVTFEPLPDAMMPDNSRSWP